VQSSVVTEHDYSVKHSIVRRNPAPVERSPCEVAIAVTKGALWVVVLLSSLALWAAVWAGAASFASAWLQ
jgi:hypothetical protein